MDRECEGTWKALRASIIRQARTLGRLVRATYSDALIVSIYLWSVWHDRTLSWACNRHNYGKLFRPRRLPSVSQLSRRIRTERCRRLLEKVHEEVGDIKRPTSISYLDGKPLVVGVASKDSEARRGHVMGGFAKGYKLHVWATEDRRIPLWSVQSLNRGEQPVACLLARHLPMLPERSLVLADSAYDSHELYRTLATRNGMLLVKPRGYSKHPVTRRQMGPVRREAIAVWERRPHLAHYVYKGRIAVEGVFSNLTSFAGGLGPLPAWVRTLPRVRRWVGAKIILYHARLLVRKQQRGGV